MKNLLALAMFTSIALLCGACVGGSSNAKYNTHKPGTFSPTMKKKEAPKREMIHSQNVSYADGAIELEGFVAFDRSFKGRRPAVMVVHDWMGIGDHTRDVVVSLARLGYYAFAADIYGKGVRPKSAEQAGQLAGKFKEDPATFRRRTAAGINFLRAQKDVDSSMIAATGYCFGGTSVLELARAGETIAGVVSFHGGLATKEPAMPGGVRAKILVLHGADDPFVPEDEVEGFMKEMKRSGADWQMTYYADAVHAFTNPNANRRGQAEYNARADRRSWIAMTLFLRELFAR